MTLLVNRNGVNRQMTDSERDDLRQGIGALSQAEADQLYAPKNVTGATNLGYTASPTKGTVTSDTGGDADLPLSDGENAGLMSPAQHGTVARALAREQSTNKVLAPSGKTALVDYTASGSAADMATIVNAAAGNSPRRATFMGGLYSGSASPTIMNFQASVDFGQLEWDASATQAGAYALQVKSAGYQNSTVFRSGPVTWKDLYITLGSNVLANGVKLDPQTVWNIENFNIQNLCVTGGNIGLTLGSNIWLLKMDNCRITGQKSIGVLLKNGTNAGEGINFFNGVIANAKSGDGNYSGIACKTEPGQTGGTWKFFGTSFDYSDRLIYHTEGFMLLSGCHLERDGPLAMVHVDQSAASTTVSLDADGCEWTHNPTSTATAIIETTGNVQVNVRGGECKGISNTETLEFLRVNSGTPCASVRGVNFGFWPGIANNIGIISRYLSLIRNGQFDAAASGWRMAPVNYLRNSNFSGGTSGSPGGNPTWLLDSGALNGLTRTLTFTDVNGRRVMRVQYTGTPTASSTVGFNLWGDSTNRIKALVGNKVSLRLYMRYAALVGASAMSMQIVERDSAGSALTSQSAYSPNPFVRTLAQYDVTLSNANTASIQAAIYWSYTAGTPVNIDVEISCPSLMLTAMDYTDVERIDTSATLPTVRYSIDASGGYNSAPCLRITSSGDSGGLYQDIPVRAGDWVCARGYVQLTAGTTGSAGLIVRWLDALGVEISNQVIRPSYLTSAATWTQHSGVRVAPSGAVTARIECHVEALTGAALFDDVMAWVV